MPGRAPSRAHPGDGARSHRLGNSLTTFRTSLQRPEATEPRQVLVRYFVPIVAVHALCLATLVPALFSWTAVVLCLAGVRVFEQTITLG